MLELHRTPQQGALLRERAVDVRMPVQQQHSQQRRLLVGGAGESAGDVDQVHDVVGDVFGDLNEAFGLLQGPRDLLERLLIALGGGVLVDELLPLLGPDTLLPELRVDPVVVDRSLGLLLTVEPKLGKTNQLLEEQLLLDELHTTKGWVHMYAMSRATELKERMFWVNRIHGRNTK